jgi:hypothetical protein
MIKSQNPGKIEHFLSEGTHVLTKTTNFAEGLGRYLYLQAEKYS